MMQTRLDHNLRRIKHSYQKKSIQYLITLSFTTVAVICVALMGIALYLRFITSAQSMIVEDNKRLIEQVNLNLDSYLRNMMGVSSSMYYRAIKNADLAEETMEKEMSLLYETNRDSLISIAVFMEDGSLVTSFPLAGLKETVKPRNQEWFAKAFSKIENFHFSTPHVQNLFEDPDYNYRWVVSLSKAVELTQNGTVKTGVLLVDMNFSGIEVLCQKVNLGKSGYIYIVDSNGDIIYHPRQQLIYSDVVQENNIQASTYEDGSYNEVFEGQNRLVTVKTVGYTGWKIVGVTPSSDLTSDYYQIQMFAVLIVFFTIFFMIFANMFVSSKIARPIKKLENSVKDLENGKLDVDIFIGGSYEIQHLGETIRSVVMQMHKLMDDIVVEQELKRKSEFDSLQSQINPHFLYNTLDSIIWMVENERYEEAIKMVTALAYLFRISLSKGKSIITVEKELEHARHYMTIQKMRYKNRFTVTMNIAPETLQLATIKLIVQPLLENAIYHGMEYMDGEGEITVTSYVKDGDLWIDVSDNGMGIPPETVKILLTDDKRKRGKGFGIGLRNVHERIQLYFGKQYGLEIESEPDEGTTMRIHLPQVDYNSLEEKQRGNE